jgi:lysine 2,3-aminomutase
MTLWQKLLSESITDPSDLPFSLRPEGNNTNRVIERYPMRINPYYLGLIRNRGDALWRQAVPDLLELDDRNCYTDPLGEEDLSPVTNVIHKYPDRVLFLVHNQCAMYCRFCTRKRKVGTKSFPVNKKSIESGFEYISSHPEIRDVLVSGGDPLLLEDDRLEWILTGLRKIPSVSIIRIGSRVPCTLPMRITVKLARMLKKFHPLYINTHFNHPDEITPESALACSRLADAGIPLGCQTVLLRDVNDEAEIIKKLMRGLLSIRVKPYYIFQGDMTRGTDHFRTPIKTGRAIMRELIGHVSGMAVPLFAVDLPGGFGKVPLGPEYMTKTGEESQFVNYRGQYCTYLDPV